MAATSEQWVKSTGAKKACLSNEKARRRQADISWEALKLLWKSNANFHPLPLGSEILEGNRHRAEMEQEASQWRMSLITIMSHFEIHLFSAKILLPYAGIKSGNATSFLRSLSWNVSLKHHVAVKLEQNHHDVMVGLLLCSLVIPSISCLSQAQFYGWDNHAVSCCLFCPFPFYSTTTSSSSNWFSHHSVFV